MNDDDRRLLEWAECSPVERSRTGEICEKRYVRYARWLMSEAGPDDWHIAADSWNWDNGLMPLTWIIRQRQCDKATALNIFYLSAPEYYLQFAGDRTRMPPWHVDNFDFICELRQRYVDGFYTRSEIALDVSNWASVWREPGAERDFPEVMRQSLSGRDLLDEPHPIYANGLPVWLLEELGINPWSAPES
jgi:hypothetical protein